LARAPFPARRSSDLQQRRVQAMQRRARGSTVVEILRRAEMLLLRVDALLDTATVQSRRASDPDVMLLDGMAERYVPELVDALEGDRKSTRLNSSHVK